MPLFVTTNYAGTDAMEIIGAALLGGDTLNAEGLTVLPGVKYKTTLHKLFTSGLIQSDSCDFTDLGNVSLEDKTITPVPQKVNVELCKTTLEQHWLSAQMRAGALNSDIPENAANFILDYIAQNVAANVDQLIWMGDVAGGDDVDGIFRQIVTDGNGEVVTYAAITSANVIAKLKEAYALIPNEVINSGELRIYCAMNVAKAYKEAVAAASAETYYIGDRPLDFLGIEMIPVRGMADSHFMIAERTNLFFGTDLMSDFNTAEVIDMSTSTGADTLRVKMRFKFDATFAFPKEITYHQNTFV